MPTNHSGVRSALAPRSAPKAEPAGKPGDSAPGHSRDKARPAGPRASSYSQLSTMAECGKRWELTYGRRVPRRPGVWFPAGTAVHRTIERYLLATLEGDHS